MIAHDQIIETVSLHFGGGYRLDYIKHQIIHALIELDLIPKDEYNCAVNGYIMNDSVVHNEKAITKMINDEFITIEIFSKWVKENM